ncbi:MAG: CbiX/SirB N-terminal domain-containing protein [Burkholderiales bacterium]|nr:CbiX/SirB N-terminal domain-containing protein [Burkholderiales bacterium]
MTTTGLILFGHGARDARWAEPFHRLADKVARARPDVPLRLAFLDFMQPDLETAAEALVAAGCEALRIVPVFFGQGGHLREDVPRVVAAVRARHPGVAVEVLDAIGENDAVLGAIARVAVDALPA